MAPTPSTRLVAFFHGTPAPQGSKSVARNGHLYEASPRLAAWRRTCAQQALVMRTHYPQIAFPLEQPVKVSLTFVFSPPKRWQPAVDFPRPDGDKLTRAVWDALVAGGVLADDRFVVAWGEGVKVYSASWSAGCHVEIETIDLGRLVHRELSS